MYFVDCMLPAGMDNGKIPDSAISATSSHSSDPPKEARLNAGKSWCAVKNSGKKEYLQIDIGMVCKYNLSSDKYQRKQIFCDFHALLSNSSINFQALILIHH